MSDPNTSPRNVRCAIVGSGPAGYTAAIYAARALLEPVLIAGIQPGGQLTITTDVENWPGDVSVLGPNLMLRMEAQAAHLETRLVDDIVTSVDLSDRTFSLTCDSGANWTADTLSSNPQGTPGTPGVNQSPTAISGKTRSLSTRTSALRAS